MTRGQKGEKCWEALNEKLLLIDPIGKIASVLVYNRISRKVICYSREIRGNDVFRTLNLNTATGFRQVARSRFRGCKKGFFIHFSEFERETDSSWWVFVVGVPLSEGTEGVHHFNL